MQKAPEFMSIRGYASKHSTYTGEKKKPLHNTSMHAAFATLEQVSRERPHEDGDDEYEKKNADHADAMQ